MSPALNDMSREWLKALETSAGVGSDDAPLAARLSGDALLWAAPSSARGGGIELAPDVWIYVMVGLNTPADTAWVEARLLKLSETLGLGLTMREAGDMHVFERADIAGDSARVYMSGTRVFFATNDDEARRAFATGQGTTKRSALVQTALKSKRSALYVSREGMQRIMGDMEPALDTGFACEAGMADAGFEALCALSEPRAMRAKLTAELLPALEEVNMSEEASRAVLKLVDGARAYLTSEQLYSAPDGEEPWHVAGAQGTETQVGFPMPWSKYVFPGGKDLVISSHTFVPKLGEPQAPVFATEEARRVFAKLGMDLEAPSQIRYTYEAHGEGAGATALIRGELDLNPDVPTNHTIEIRLSVDPETQEVRVHPMVVMHDGD
jgi:hypothetical protein